MNYKSLSLTIISLIGLLTACEAANDTSMTHLDDQLKESSQVDTKLKDEQTSISALSDGHYFAEEADYSTDGWKNIVNFDIIDGELNNLMFDAINEDATAFKRELSLNEIDTSDETNWYKSVQFIEKNMAKYQLAELLENNWDLINDSENNMDLNSFTNLMNTALATGPIELGNYRDGHYYAETLIEDSNLLHTMDLLVQNGYIISVNWNTASNSETISLASQTVEQEKSSKQWLEQSNLLEQYLIDIQDPMQMTFNEENKTTDINGVTIDVRQFIELATNALANGPVID